MPCISFEGGRGLRPENAQISSPLPPRGCPSVAPPPSSVGRSGRRVVKGDGVQLTHGAGHQGRAMERHPGRNKATTHKEPARIASALVVARVVCWCRIARGVWCGGCRASTLTSSKIALFAPLSGAGCSTSTRPHKAKAARHQARHLNPSTGHRLSRSGLLYLNGHRGHKGHEKAPHGAGLVGYSLDSIKS